MEKPDTYQWKRSYTVVLVANALYILAFYLIMNYFA